MVLLREIGVPPRLYRHAELVGEAADLLLAGLRRLSFNVNEEYVRVGVALHDVGKTVHQNELIESGNNHEPEGERLLPARGVTPDVARVCRSHAQWRTVAQTTEELLVALSDKLWKGARNAELEEFAIDQLAAMQSKDRWDCFTDLDSLFEDIASTAQTRLERSNV